MKITNYKFKRSTLNLSMSLALGTLVSIAFTTSAEEVEKEEVDTSKIEVITVTARRKSEALQDVPLSLSAFSEESLKNAGIKDITGLANITAGLTIQEGVDDNTARFFIRGMGTVTPTVGVEPAVPVYVDDVYMPSGLGSKLDLFSLSRVEVLKGPQGTLYGRNSFGGAIKIYTKSIDVDETEGNLAFTVGSFERRNMKAEIRTPLIEDKLWFGAGIAHLERDGLQDLVNIDKKGWAENSDIYNAKLLFTPNDDLSFTFSYDYTEKDAPAKAMKAVDNGPFNLAWTGLAGIHPEYQGTNPTSSNIDEIETEVGANSAVESEGFTLKAEWYINDNLTLEYIGADRDMSNQRIFDIDGTAAPFLTVAEDYRLKATNHELRISGSAGDTFDWSGGVFYYKEETSGQTMQPVQNFYWFLDAEEDHLHQLITDVEGRQTGVDIGAAFDTLEQKTESIAVYFNGTMEIMDNLNLTAGIRWTEDDKSQSALFPQTVFVGGGANYTSTPAFPSMNVPAGATILTECFGAGAADCQPSFTEDTYSEITPEFTLDYHIDDDLMVYSSYKKGFQAGTIFSAASKVPGAGTSTDSQLVDAFEVGFKGMFLDNTLMLNGAAFYYDYDGLLVAVNTPVPIEVSATGYAGVPQNAGSANTVGMELESEYRVSEDFIVRANIAYTNLDINEVNSVDPETGEVINIADQYMDTYSLTPEFQGSLTFEYFKSMQSGEWRLFTTIAYRDEIGTNAANANETSGIGLVLDSEANRKYYISDSLTTVIAGATFKTSDDKWRIDLVGNNLTDERRPVATVFSVPGMLGSGTLYNAPRTVELTATYNF